MLLSRAGWPLPEVKTLSPSQHPGNYHHLLTSGLCCFQKEARLPSPGPAWNAWPLGVRSSNHLMLRLLSFNRLDKLWLDPIRICVDVNSEQIEVKGHWIQNSILGIRAPLKGKIIIGHSMKFECVLFTMRKLSFILFDWHYPGTVLISKKQTHPRQAYYSKYVAKTSAKEEVRRRLGNIMMSRRAEGTAESYLCISENLWRPSLPRLTHLGHHYTVPHTASWIWPFLADEPVQNWIQSQWVSYAF